MPTKTRLVGLKASETGCLRGFLGFNLHVRAADGVTDGLYAVLGLLVDDHFLNDAGACTDYWLFDGLSHFDHAFLQRRSGLLDSLAGSRGDAQQSHAPRVGGLTLRRASPSRHVYLPVVPLLLLG